MGFPYENVIWPAGSDNMAGLSTSCYFAPARAIVAMPEIADADKSVRRGAFTMAQDAGFVEVYITYATGGLSSEPVGDTDCRCSKLTGEFFHPGDTEAMARFARAVQNTPGVFIFIDSAGRKRIVGDATHPAVVKAKHETGKKPEDRKGWTISFEAYSTYPVMFFEGDVPVVGK